MQSLHTWQQSEAYTGAMVVIAAHTAHCEVAHVAKRVAAHTRYIAQASCAIHIIIVNVL